MMKRSLGTRTSHAPRRGLSLIEVLLALAIFVMALTAIGRLVDMGTDRELDGRLQTQGSRLVQSKLAEFESGAAALESGSGTFEGDDAGWQWTAEVAAQSTPNLYLVTITATREARGRPVTLSMAQMIFDPTLFGTAAEATRPDGESSDSGGMP
jgi:general secretion pathway protein I